MMSFEDYEEIEYGPNNGQQLLEQQEKEILFSRCRGCGMRVQEDYLINRRCMRCQK